MNCINRVKNYPAKKSAPSRLIFGMNGWVETLYSGGVWSLLWCLILMLSACTGSKTYPDFDQINSVKLGQLSLFLNLVKREASNQKLRIKSIELLAETNNWVVLPFQALTADSRSIPSGQLFLGRSLLSPGYYSKLRVTTTMVSGVSPEPQPVTQELTLRNPLYVGTGGSSSLFLVWNLSISASGEELGPRLSIAPRLKRLQRDIAYVACPKINTVYMICTDKNWVCDSLGVKGGPVYLFSDPVAPAVNLFALSEDDKDIKRIGPASNRVEASYRLPSLGRGLHFAIDPTGTWAYVIDRRRGNILRVNLRTGGIDARNRLGYEPSYVLYLEKQGLLAVSLSRSQTVVFLDPQTLDQVRSISTGNRPEGLLLYNDNLLYVAEAGGNTVMVYDLTRNTFKQRIPVGLSPRRLLAVDTRIYVSNYTSRSISILKYGQLSVSKSISLSGSPRELAFSPLNRWLYVGNEMARALDIIDPTSGKIVGRISLGGRPEGIAVLD